MCVCVGVKSHVRFCQCLSFFKYWQSCNSPNLTTASLFNLICPMREVPIIMSCAMVKKRSTPSIVRVKFYYFLFVCGVFVKIISFSFWHGLFEDLSIRNSVTKGGGISSLIGFPVDLSTFWQVCARQRSVVISLTPAGAMVRGANLKIGVNFWKREFFF